jgi:uncharacterized membrane protein
MSTDEGERLTTKSSGQVSWDKRPGILGGIALAVVLLAAALRIYRLDWQSVWFDEVFSLIVAAPSQRFEEFWGWVRTDVHPPLYYLLLRIWSGILGQSEAATRSLSAIFGVLTVAAAGIVFRPALSPVGRVSLMLLFAVSPAAIRYSQEVRSYALLIFLATLLTGLCTHHLRASSPREANRVVAVLTLVAVLASFTHYFGFLFAVTALFTCLVGTIDDRGRSWGVITGIVVVVATFLPWVIYHGPHESPHF